MSKLNRYMITWCILILCFSILCSTYVAPIIGLIGSIICSGIFGLYSWEVTSWFTGIAIEDIE